MRDKNCERGWMKGEPDICVTCSDLIWVTIPWIGHTMREAKLIAQLAPHLDRERL